MVNLGLPAFGWRAPDPFPFPILAMAAATVDLILAAMILIAQRCDACQGSQETASSLKSTTPSLPIEPNHFAASAASVAFPTLEVALASR